MTTITRISKDKGEFYLLWLSPGRKLRVSEGILVRQRLLKGQELSDTLIEEIKKASSCDVGLQMAMNYLGYQLRSKKEIFTYLKEKEIVPKDQVETIQRLEELRLLGDAIFSESYVRITIRTSNKGPRNVA